jgi:hypothetical protein
MKDLSSEIQSFPRTKDSPERIDPEHFRSTLLVESIESHVVSDCTSIRKEEIQSSFFFDRLVANLLNQRSICRVSIEVGDL